MRWLSLGKGRFYADVAAILKTEVAQSPAEFHLAT